jgi:hypothetical protein
VALGLAIGIASALYATWLWDRALSDGCDAWEVTDLSMGELIALKQRKDAYQHDPSPDAALELSGQEISFLMRDVLDYGVFVRFLDGDVDALVAIPGRNGCYNVRFVGTVEVDEGVAVVVPRVLVVGEADLSGLVGGLRLVVRPEDLADPGVAESLQNTERLDIEGDRLRLRLSDPWQIW